MLSEEMNYKIGDIYWYNIPSIDGTPTIAHPNVIISTTTKGQINKMTLCGITTNMKKINWPGNTLLEKGEANLEKKSIVDVSQISVTSSNQLGGYMGTLSTKRMDEIRAGMKVVKPL